VSDGTPEPAYTRDPELYYHPTTWPGARLPHAWLGRDGHRVSTDRQQEVRGVVIKRESLELADWVGALTGELREQAASSAQALWR